MLAPTSMRYGAGLAISPASECLARATDAPFYAVRLWQQPRWCVQSAPAAHCLAGGCAMAEPPSSRSRITNGALIDGDGRSAWSRRMRDLINLHLSDLGGADNVSEAEKSIVRRVATLTVELERMESVFAEACEASPEQLDLYQRVSNSMRRMLETVGLERRAKPVETLQEYLRKKDEAK